MAIEKRQMTAAEIAARDRQEVAAAKLSNDRVLATIDQRAIAEAVVAQRPPEVAPLDLSKAKQINVRMMPEELDAIDNARGKVSRQDFLRRAALWLADQAEKLGL